MRVNKRGNKRGGGGDKRGKGLLKIGECIGKNVHDRGRRKSEKLLSVGGGGGVTLVWY